MMWYSLLIKWGSNTDLMQHWITNDIVIFCSTYINRPISIKITIIKKDNILGYVLGDDSKKGYLEYYKVI